MAAPNYLSGVTGFITVTPPGTDFDFQKWGLSLKTGLPKVNNFSSAFQILVAGLSSATITADGPYNEGNMPLVSGNYYAFALGWDAGISILVSGYIESLDLDNDVEAAPRVRITAQSSGSFTLSIA